MYKLCARRIYASDGSSIFSNLPTATLFISCWKHSICFLPIFHFLQASISSFLACLICIIGTIKFIFFELEIDDAHLTDIWVVSKIRFSLFIPFLIGPSAVSRLDGLIDIHLSAWPKRAFTGRYAFSAPGNKTAFFVCASYWTAESRAQQQQRCDTTQNVKSEAALCKPSRGFGFDEIEPASGSIRRNRTLPSLIAVFCTRIMPMVVGWISGCCVDVLRTLDNVKNALLAQRLPLSRRQRLVAGTGWTL